MPESEHHSPPSATGTKLAKRPSSDRARGQRTDYVGRFVFKDEELSYILTDQGRIIQREDGSYEFQYFITDHLGNTRVVFNDEGHILQDNSYYPFGMRMDGLDYTAGLEPENKHLYNAEKPEISDFIVFRASTKNDKNHRFFIFRDGKELQDDFGLDWYDYGARMYDAAIGRWHVVDPMAEKYYGLSTYTYGKNNPLKYIDPNGQEVDDFYFTQSGELVNYVENDKPDRVFIVKGKTATGPAVPATSTRDTADPRIYTGTGSKDSKRRRRCRRS